MSRKGLPRLLVLTSTYPRWAGDHEPGFVHELAKRLVGSFRVTVVCPHAAGARRRELLDGVEVVRYRYAPEKLERLVNDGGVVTNLRRRPWTSLLVPTFVLAQVLATWVELRRGSVAAIHAHWLVPQGLVAALWTSFRALQAPILVTSHGADLFALRSGFMSSLKRFVLRRARAVTIVSGGMRDLLLDLGVDPEKVRVEPMGVDLTNTFRPDRAVTRSANQLLFVGRLVEKKGLWHLIDALPLVLLHRPDVELVVAGYGPEEERCRQRAVELGLSEKIHFVGPVAQSELPGFYRRASLFVAPFVEAASGDQDGLGLVLVEALGCGCPVVVSDLPATRGLIGLGAGLTAVTAGSPESIAQGILRALATPATSGPDLSDFDWKARALAYEELLRSIAKPTA